MPFDNTCKFLAETFPEDLASWLLGESLPVTKLEPSELSVEPIRADSLIFLESEQKILHIEFQVNASSEIPFRMADYYLRLYRRSPEKLVVQVVIYLSCSDSPQVYKTQFNTEKLRHEFNVIRIWECRWEEFLAQPGLYPFAVLAKNNNPKEVLGRVVSEIEAIPDLRKKREIAASTYVLAGLILKEEVIRSLMREEVMRESVTYQAIQNEGLQRGLQQGLEQERSLVLRLLTRQIGAIPDEARSRLENLPVEQLEALAEALLDFSSPADLERWLQENSVNR